jgi:hypothetical protein
MQEVKESDSRTRKSEEKNKKEKIKLAKDVLNCFRMMNSLNL